MSENCKHNLQIWISLSVFQLLREGSYSLHTKLIVLTHWEISTCCIQSFFAPTNKYIPLLFDNQLGSWSHLSDPRRVLITHVSSVNTQTIKNNRLPWYFRLVRYCIQNFYHCRPTDISWYRANDRTSKRFSIFLDLCVRKQDFYQSNSRYYTQILMLNAIKCTFCLSY